MAAIEAEGALQAATSGSVRRKSNNTRKLVSKAGRITRSSPEVMVKITGFGKGAAYIAAHMKYISRDGEVELENDRGERIEGQKAVEEYFKGWQQDLGDSKRHKDQRDTMNMILSMPPGTPDESVRRAARDFAREKFGKNHEYVFAFHNDADGGNPHVHLTVKMLGFDNTRLNPRKADLQEWREGFAQAMRDQGEDAEATPRTTRGVIRKPQRQVIHHIERGDKTHAPRTPRVYRCAVDEAAAELTAADRGTTLPPSPGNRAREKAMAAHQARRDAWLAAAAALDRPKPIIWKHENAKPDYANADSKQQRALHSAAAVYQSRPARYGTRLAPAALASMRNMPGLAVVHDAARTQVLLHPNAPDRVGHVDAPPHLGVRRPRAGDRGDSGGRERGVGAEASANPEKALAARIRGFVEALPPADLAATRFEQIKAGLRAHLAAGVDQVRATQPPQQPARPQPPTLLAPGRGAESDPRSPAAKPDLER